NPARAVTSDPALAWIASESGISLELVLRPGSEAIAEIGARKLLSGDTVSVEALDANYLRRSDAEIFFKGTRSRGSGPSWGGGRHPQVCGNRSPFCYVSSVEP